MTKVCPKCGNTVSERPGPGRPATYCGAVCRRLAEFEIRQLRRLLDGVREQISWCHLGLNLRTVVEVPKFEAEVQRLEGRLRELVGDDTVDVDTAGE